MDATDNIYNIATCWKIETQNKNIIGITNHTSNLIIDGIDYDAKASFTPNELKRAADLKQNSLNIEGMLSHDLISKKDIEAGFYDHAKIDIFLVDYNRPDQLKTIIFSGSFGKISFDDNQYQVEVYSISDSLSNKFGDIYSSSCRAEFCDKKCKLNIENFTFTAKVISVVNEHEFILQLDEKNNYDFTGGVLEYRDSKNIIKSSEIFFHKENHFKVKDKLNKDFEFGDLVKLKRGCDKRFSTCASTYNNALNFRGEPHVPSQQNF